MKPWPFVLAGALASSMFIPTASAAPDLIRVATQRLAGATHVNVARTDSGVAMRSFNFAFMNGDHKLRSIGLLPAAGRVDVDFSDADGQDPYLIEADYVRLAKMGPSKVVSKMCVGRCDVRIDLPPRDERFILQGFRFTRRRSGDANIRQIGIRPKVESGKVEVVLEDQAGDRGDQYTVDIRYAYAPAALVQRIGTITRSHDGKKSVPVTGIRAGVGGSIGMGIIQGFEFRFDNGGHHIKQVMAKDISAYGPTNGTSGPTTFQVAYFDNNTDDPWTATIDYAVLTQQAWFR